MNTRVLPLVMVLILGLFACSSTAPVLEEQDRPSEEFSNTAIPQNKSTQPVQGEDPVSPPEQGAINRRIDDQNEYFITQLLPRDGIRPVYDPKFVSAGEAELQEEELVIGLELGGVAKAYPISVLRFREMVNDEVAGWPVLVTW